MVGAVHAFLQSVGHRIHVRRRRQERPRKSPTPARPLRNRSAQVRADVVERITFSEIDSRRSEVSRRTARARVIVRLDAVIYIIRRSVGNRRISRGAKNGHFQGEL